MVLCWLALPVFAFLSIFSVKYRKLTLDSMDCMFRTMTLRKCKSGLDDKIRADISGTFLKFSPKLAKFFYKHYKIISWIILVIFIWSTYMSSVSTYNYVKYGNCNGPESVGFCVFDPVGANSGCSIADLDVHINQTVKPVHEIDDPILGSQEAELTIYEFGCYSCEYSKNAEPILSEVFEHYGDKVNLEFKTFYIPNHIGSFKASLAANCAFEQGKYKEYHDKLFSELYIESENGDMESEEFVNEQIRNLAEDVDLDLQKFDQCMLNETYADEVNSDQLQGMQAGVIGTPTFFIGDSKIIGPKPFRTFKTIIDKELEAISAN